AGTPAEAAVREYVDRVGRESAEERGAEDREKTGVPLGRSVVNPVNGEPIPMYIADYVLMGYGTGAIMAVPAHDGRDFEFARAFELPMRCVVEPSDDRDADPAEWEDAFSSYDGTIVNSTGEGVSLDGLGVVEAKAAITAWLAERG